MHPNQILVQTIIAERERDARERRLISLARAADCCRRAASRLSRLFARSERPVAPTACASC